MSYEQRRARRKAANQAEIDALLALCHHSPMQDDCDACVFRQQACIEHLQRQVAATVACLSGIHTGCHCEEEARARQMDIYFSLYEGDE